MKVSIRSLSKTYPGGVRALDDVNLEIGEGMFGLLGPNGAGKSTLLSILATLAKPTRGIATVDGWDVTDHRHKWLVKEILGYLPQELGLYPDLSAAEFMHYLATLKGFHERRKRDAEVDRLLELVGLESVRRRKTRDLSGGMKRRLGIAQALIGDPQLLIVDEPTAGLDPGERVRLRTLLASLAPGRVVILSTHIVEDVAATCHDLAVLVAGKVSFRGAPTELANVASGRVWQLKVPDGEVVRPSWQVVASVSESDGSRVRVLGEQPTIDAVRVEPTLEDGYLCLLHGQAQPTA